MIEIPIRYEFAYLKRVPGKFQFFYIGRLAATGRIIAVPEDDLALYLEYAEVNGFNDAQLGDLDYLPAQWQAVGETMEATVMIEHTGELRFFENSDGKWIFWDDDHPAPEVLLNGVAVTEWGVANVPATPNPANARIP